MMRGCLDRSVVVTHIPTFVVERSRRACRRTT